MKMVEIISFAVLEWQYGPNNEEIICKRDIGIEKIREGNLKNVFWILEDKTRSIRSAVIPQDAQCDNCTFFNRVEQGGQCDCFAKDPNVPDCAPFSVKRNPHMTEMVCPSWKPILSPK